MIIPTILEQDFKEVKRKIAIAEKFAGVIQIDIADGQLVDGKTFLDVNLLNTISTSAELELDLMVENPLMFINKKIKNVVKACAHVETVQYTDDFIKKARAHGYAVGLALNPETPTDTVLDYLQELDYVQFLTVEPGAQGRPLEQEVLSKAKEFKENNPHMHLQLDGGIKEENLAEVLKVTGADNFTVGSAIFTAENPAEKYARLLHIEQEGRIGL